VSGSQSATVNCAVRMENFRGLVRPNDLLFGDNVYVTSVSTGRFNALRRGPTVAIGMTRAARLPGTNDWSATSNKISWIESVIRLAYGSTYSCARGGAGADAYMQCF
jgi:hypothetical protein